VEQEEQMEEQEEQTEEQEQMEEQGEQVEEQGEQVEEQEEQEEQMEEQEQVEEDREQDLIAVVASVPPQMALLLLPQVLELKPLVSHVVGLSFRYLTSIALNNQVPSITTHDIFPTFLLSTSTSTSNLPNSTPAPQSTSTVSSALPTTTEDTSSTSTDTSSAADSAATSLSSSSSIGDTTSSTVCQSLIFDLLL